MNILQYLESLNNDSQKIFDESTKLNTKLGELHNYATHIYEFAQIINDIQEREMLITVSGQLESAMYILSLGLYRQAFSSLRLAFEMGLAAIYFSAYKLEMQEWLLGSNDIKWSRLIDEDNGVLSERFLRAFYEECSADAIKYNAIAKSTYRQLSEFVHGNRETWVKDGIKLQYNEDLIDMYLRYHKHVVQIILLVAFCRYKSMITEEIKDDVDFIAEIFNHIKEIRNFFGQF